MRGSLFGSGPLAALNSFWSRAFSHTATAVCVARGSDPTNEMECAAGPSSQFVGNGSLVLANVTGSTAMRPS